MIEILNDIKKAYNAGALRSAFALALTLPDICGQLEYPNNDCGSRYALWIDNFLENTIKSEVVDIVITNSMEAKKEVVIDGRTYYRLRCTYLHSGSTDLSKDKSDYPEFHFILSSTKDEKAYANMSVDVNGKQILYIDIRNEINKLVHSAIHYYKTHPSKCEFEKHKLEIIDTERHFESIRKNNREAYDEIKDWAEKFGKAFRDGLQLK